MPRLCSDGSGRYVSGTAAGVVSLGDQPTSPSHRPKVILGPPAGARALDQRDCGWLSDHEVCAQVDGSRFVACDVNTGAIRLLHDSGSFYHVAGGGHWWIEAPDGIWMDGVPLAVNPGDFGGAHGFSEDGSTCAWFPWFRQGLRLRYLPTGDDLRLTDGVASDVQVFSSEAVLWREGRVIYSLGVPFPVKPAQLPGDIYWHRACWFDGRPWRCYTNGWRVVLHPADSLLGYEFTAPAPTGAYRLDLGVVAVTGLLRCVWSVRDGDSPDDIRCVDVDGVTGMHLLQPAVADQPPPPDPIPPTPPLPPQPPSKEPPVSAGPSLDAWTNQEFPSVVQARRDFLTDPNWQPDPNWVILQMARRYGFGLPPGEAPWPLQKMIDHEHNPEGH